MDACGLFSSSAERVLYDFSCDKFKKGKYRAVLRHSSNCQQGPTKYAIRVVVDGRLKKMAKGRVQC